MQILFFPKKESRSLQVCILNILYRHTKYEILVVTTFTLEKQPEILGPITFLIVGMRDGSLARIDLATGHIEYKTSVSNNYNKFEDNQSLYLFVH
jgi:hypothetical protein